MKKILKYSLVLVLMALSFSCEKRLGDLNVNKIDPTSVDPVSLLNNAIVNTSFPTRTVQYDVGVVQQMVTPNGGVLAGANFNVDVRDPGIWSAYFQNVIKYTHDVIVKTKDNPARSNLYNMARIIQANAYLILT